MDAQRFFKRAKIRSDGRLTTDDPQGIAMLREAVDVARALPQAMSAVKRLYGDLADAISQRQPVCTASGRCCRFEAYGHRMYVSTIELARFIEDLEAAGEPVGDPSWDGSGCPFQVGGLCGVHAIRPLGCRTFYCDPSSTQWQNQLYERHHAELRALHDELGIGYRYVEWREALRAFGFTAKVVTCGTQLTIRGRAFVNGDDAYVER